MDDIRKVVIEISDIKEANKQDETKVFNEGKTNLNALLHPIQNVKSELSSQHPIIGMAAQKAMGNVVQAVEFGLERRFSLKEDYLAQNTYNAIKVTVSKTKGLFSSIASGASVGASLGPIGALAGAAISGLSYGISEVINYNSRMSSYYQALNATNMQTEFGAIRAGLINNGRGTEN